MHTTALTRYHSALLMLSRAEAEFETSLPSDRAKNKVELAKATLVVATAARKLHAALDDSAMTLARGDIKPTNAPQPHPGRPGPAPAERQTGPVEEDLLRQLLMRELLPSRRFPASPATSKARLPLARSQNGSFVSRRRGPAADATPDHESAKDS